MLSATTRPWDVATGGNKATPVTSPAAPNPGPPSPRPAADVGGFPVGPHRHLAEALDGRADRIRSGGDHHVPGFQQLPPGLDPAGPGEPGRALDDRGAGLLVVLDLGGVIEVADHVVVVV